MYSSLSQKEVMMMSKFDVQWASFESRWRGEINNSTLVITKKTLDRKNRYDLVNKGSYCIYIILGLWFLFELRVNFTNIDDGFNLSIVIPFVILIATVSAFQMLVNIYKAPYYKIKDLLMKRTEAELCNCVASYWGYSCSKEHKETFLKDVKDTFDLNLYY